MHHQAKFNQNQPSGCGDIIIFPVSKNWWSSTNLQFLILEYFSGTT